MGPEHPALRLWLAWGKAIAAYHRYHVEGIEHLCGAGSKLIVGYHGRAMALDLIALGRVLHQQLGYMPHSVVHRYFEHNRVTKWLMDGLGFVTADGPRIADAVRAGQHILVLPGGSREANRSSRVRYQVDWGHRTGFLRLALRYDLPLVPVASSGVDDTYIGVNDGYRWGKRLGLPHGVPAWLGIGPLGLCPLSPPFPVRIHQLVGRPISCADLGLTRASDASALQRASWEVQSRVQRLLDEARSGASAASAAQTNLHGGVT